MVFDQNVYTLNESSFALPCASWDAFDVRIFFFVVFPFRPLSMMLGDEVNFGHFDCYDQKGPSQSSMWCGNGLCMCGMLDLALSKMLN